jgi:hypothetical protein
MMHTRNGLHARLVVAEETADVSVSRPRPRTLTQFWTWFVAWRRSRCRPGAAVVRAMALDRIDVCVGGRARRRHRSRACCAACPPSRLSGRLAPRRACTTRTGGARRATRRTMRDGHGAWCM